MDSEKMGEITLGCAGVTGYTELKDVPMVNIGDTNHKKISVSISGGNGGHSGAQIQEGHINPIKAILSELNDIPNVKLASIEGGTKFNAIPKDATAVIYVPQEALEKVLAKLHKDLNEVKNSHSDTDPGVKIDIKPDSPYLYPVSDWVN